MRVGVGLGCVAGVAGDVGTGLAVWAGAFTGGALCVGALCVGVGVGGWDGAADGAALWCSAGFAALGGCAGLLLEGGAAVEDGCAA